jgi:hypothetical protein
MPTLAEILAARRAAKFTPAEEPVSPLFFMLLYDKLLTIEGSWDEHDEIIRLFSFWLGPADIPPTDLTAPHWSQINWQVFRLAASLLPKDATYASIQQAALYLWTSYKQIKIS